MLFALISAAAALMALALGAYTLLLRCRFAEWQSEARWNRLLLDHATDAILLLDEDGRVVSASRLAVELFGYTAAELSGQSVKSVMIGPHSSPGLSGVSNEGLNAVAWSGILMNGRHKDGTLLPMRVTARRVRGAPPAQVALSVHGVTPQLENEAELRRYAQQLEATKAALLDHNRRLEAEVHERTQELSHAKEIAERANTAKSRFITFLSHELRTPFHAIISFARFGRRSTGAAAEEKLRRYFEQIENSALSQLQLVDELLDLAKLESGTYQFVPATVLLNEVVAQVVEELSGWAGEHGVELSFRTTGKTTIEGDERRIAQLARNLIANAIKFSPPAGRIVAKVTSSEEIAWLHVMDQGPGIPPEQLETVFDRFAQAGAPSAGTNGTGLGLAICREIANLHGGAIRARNSQGGAVISVRLPVKLPHHDSILSERQVCNEQYERHDPNVPPEASADRGRQPDQSGRAGRNAAGPRAALPHSGDAGGGDGRPLSATRRSDGLLHAS